MTDRLTRRSVLKLGAAFAAGWTVAAAVPWPLGHTPLRIATTWPLAGYDGLPSPEHLLQQRRSDLDVALVPAYVAATLIQRGQAQPIGGGAGRAHDPDGHYTVPYAYRVTALRYASEATAPRAASWAELWTAGQGAWPAWGRVVAGAALMRRGYSPNDTHPGHLAQAAADLASLKRMMTPNPAAQRAPLALVLADPAELGQPNGLRLPAEGAMLIEYDWVVLADTPRLAAARQFVHTLPAAQRPNLPMRLIPLMPLPQAANVQHAALWAAVSA